MTCHGELSTVVDVAGTGEGPAQHARRSSQNFEKLRAHSKLPISSTTTFGSLALFDFISCEPQAGSGTREPVAARTRWELLAPQLRKSVQP